MSTFSKYGEAKIKNEMGIICTVRPCATIHENEVMATYCKCKKVIRNLYIARKYPHGNSSDKFALLAAFQWKSSYKVEKSRSITSGIYVSKKHLPMFIRATDEQVWD